ncbi:Type 4 prepilin-like proteins leader peptide-processing enzyme [Candidatus Vallotia cooleyia]|nr:Type 4 prepilin-like proteins leader peptide-processing enzyme [Candidatus Vallotia cooleyia]
MSNVLTVIIYRIPLMLKHTWQQELAEYTKQSALRRIEDDKYDASSNPADKQKPGSLEQIDSLSCCNLWMLNSPCTVCEHKLRLYKSIPLLNFCTWQGRCLTCGRSIDWCHLFMILTCPVLAALSLKAFGYTLTALIAFAFCAAILGMSAIDLETKLLPDALTLPLLWAGLLINLHSVFVPLDAAVIGAVTGYISLWTVCWLFKLVCGGVEGIGYGDFKLFSAIGAWLGWNSLLQVILIASVCGLIVGLSATLAKRMRLTEPLPFGPFLGVAAVLTLFCGTPLYRLLGG